MDQAAVSAESETHRALSGTRVAVVGLGYVGLPTALCAYQAGAEALGIDISLERLDAIRGGQVEVLPLMRDRLLLRCALDDARLQVTDQFAALGEADLVLICVPTPIDEQQRPDERALRSACTSVVQQTRPGQAVVLTSTSSVGSTRRLLIEPLQQRGLVAGRDVYVAFSPERINPGDDLHHQQSVPRVYGAASEACERRLAPLLSALNPQLHRVPSPEHAEMTKLQENAFRALNIALANELADVCRSYQLDPITVTEAAATKPYGFLPHYPGPGAGGHCIPCDPHYLLAGAQARGVETPLLERGMRSLHWRPEQVARRVLELVEAQARILVVGVTYKPGVQDTRQSPALHVLQRLQQSGLQVAYHDPLVERLDQPKLTSIDDPRRHQHDLAVLLTVQPGYDYRWLDHESRLLDCTYRRLEQPGQDLHRL